ncbi:PurR-regulated permease PerM [Haloferula helveola]|uniref:PurR-regulated permease PerM n=1 Tax=Haloferula helveola TaxID=490095 RepID=A0ABM7R9C5_9BACT|nr:PurR-regulated permease PerM [Haloferula helveola]
MPNESSEPQSDADEESFGDRRTRWCRLKESVSLISVSQVGLFLLVAGYVLHHSRVVLLPVVLAILASLVLYPVYLAFRKLRLPRIVASSATVAGLVGLVGFGSYQLIEPGAQWMESIDGEVVATRVQEVFRPVKEVQDGLKEVADKVERVTKAKTPPKDDDAKSNAPEDEDSQNATNEEPDEKLAVVSVDKESDKPESEVEEEQSAPAEEEPEPEPVTVEIREDPLEAVVSTLQDIGLGLVAFLFLVLFILAYGNRIIRCLGESEGTGIILDRMGNDVSRYLFTITLINFCLGTGIGIAMWLLGMPNPALWGVLGMLLNFIPYVGALIGTGVVFLAAAASFDTPGAVLIVPCVYFALTAIEGNVVTPLVLGERFRLNPLVVFLWIFAWAGFWGIAGMLIAMPALVSFKIVCENTATLERFRKVLEA